MSLVFLIDTGAQISVLNKWQADALGIKPSKKAINIVRVTEVAERCPLVRTPLWLPGERRMTSLEVALSPHKRNILGFNTLASRRWCLPGSRVWSFRSREAETTDVIVLQNTPMLPHSKLTCVLQCPPPSAAKHGITTDDLERRQIISQTHSSYNSLVWPVRKPDGW